MRVCPNLKGEISDGIEGMYIMRKNSWLLLFALFLAGCPATEIVSIGRDTYMISKHGWIPGSSVGSLTADLYKKANAYCSKHNKHLMTVSTTTRPGSIEAELKFKCIESDQRKIVAERERLERERRRIATLRRAQEKRTERKAITPSSKAWRIAGSGLILRGTSYALTSYHVIQQGESIRVTLPSGEVYPALVVAERDGWREKGGVSQLFGVREKRTERKAITPSSKAGE